MSRYQLHEDTDGLHLVDRYSQQRPLRIDFAGSAFDYRLRRGGGRKELLARAVGFREGLKVLDTTAGLGRDGFLLAHLGCEVTMVERSPVIGALLKDGLTRAAAEPVLAETVSRIHLILADAIDVLRRGDISADVVTVDPMFPERRKSASVKGEMQILQRFLGKDGDVEQLIAAALASDANRIVVKRPVAAPEPANVAYSLKGSASRFDVLLNPKK